MRNGFPLRIHISDHYGMKQPKWITEIEVLNHDDRRLLGRARLGQGGVRPRRLGDRHCGDQSA